MTTRKLTQPWTYKVRGFRVIDGDTIDAELDLGFGVYMTQRLRFARINAPEMSTAAGPVSKAELEKLLTGKALTVQTKRGTVDEHDKYGRYIAEVWVEGNNINDLMVEHGFAVKYEP